MSGLFKSDLEKLANDVGYNFLKIVREGDGFQDAVALIRTAMKECFERSALQLDAEAETLEKSSKELNGQFDEASAEWRRSDATCATLLRSQAAKIRKMKEDV